MTIVAPSAAKKLPPLGPGEFRFITNALTADAGEGENPRRRFRAIASSTITDLMGNTISLAALQQMRDDFKAGLPIFMDHDYTNVVDKVFGTSDSAEIVQTDVKDERTGAPIYDLVIGGGVNEPNPKAVQLHDSIAGGYVKFGTSIGAIVRKHKRDKDTGGMLIDALNVKEASIVGIPKNQRSWVYKASHAAADLPEDADLSDDDEPEETAEEQVIASSGEPLQQWRVTIPNTDTTTVTNSTISTNELITFGEETPAEQPPEAAPEAVEATETAPTDETTPGGQEADAATPETAPATEDAADPAIEQQADIEVEDVAALVNHVKGLVEEVGRLRADNARLLDEVTGIKASYDRLSGVERDATDAINKVMSLPLRRQAVGHVNDLVERYPGLDPRVTAYIARATQEKE